MHRSYKRAEQSRAGRQDGRTYRFSEALDALHAATARAWLQKHQEQLLMVLGGRGPPQPHAAFSAPRPMSAMPPPPPPPPRFPIMPAPVSWAAPAAAVELPQPPPVCLQGLSVPSMSESGSDDDDGPEDGEMAAATGDGPGGLGKRKRGGVRKKMMAFVEGLMKQVVERQEEMQQRFLAAMEKREAERAAREEAWRRQEVARLKREQEQRAHERAAAAARHASVIAFIQRVGGQAAQVPPVVFPTPTPTPTPTPMQFQTSLPSQATPEPIAAAPLQRQPPPQPRQKLPPRRATP
uniref:Trihelix transcription factor GT-2 n=2 Tax=Triticum urartu TaxID=4572 RepID=A0A8R7QLK9_TRIUA